MAEVNYLGQNLKYFRKVKGLSHVEVTKQFEVSRTTWANYENGATEPDLKTLIKLSKFFDVTIDDLILKDLSIYQAPNEIITVAKHNEDMWKAIVDLQTELERIKRIALRQENE